jgi:hypothetical protein
MNQTLRHALSPVLQYWPILVTTKHFKVEYLGAQAVI